MTRRNIDYSKFGSYDFLMDRKFKKWVLSKGENKELEQYWHNVMERYPDQSGLIMEAKKAAEGLASPVKTALSDRKSVVWSAIKSEISDRPDSETPLLRIRPLYKRVLPYAALVFLISGISVGIWMDRHEQPVQVTAGYGESRKLILPDSSEVILGANSSVTYYKSPNRKNIREVWVEGEAGFHVKHLNKNPSKIKDNERFIVHLKNSVDVEVLGTVFNVNDRRGKAAVNLESGAVRLSTPSIRQLMLSPGQTVVVNQKTGALLEKEKAPSVQRKWENNTLLLNKTSIKELIEIMKDNYGINILLESQTALERKIDGVLPLNDAEKALLILSSITDTQISKKQDVIVLSPR